MSNVTCGQCVCPIPSPTPEILSTDLCQLINSTHSICHISGGLYSWDGAFTMGIVVGIFVFFCFYLVWKMFEALNKVVIKK